MAKTRTLVLRDITGTYFLDGDKEGPSIEYVVYRPKHGEEAANFATDRKAKYHPERYTEAWWGLLIRGWQGFVDESGAPIPVSPPESVRKEIRDESGGKLTDAEVERAASFRWKHRFVGYLPGDAQPDLRAAINRDEKPASEALGNSEPSSVNV